MALTHREISKIADQEFNFEVKYYAPLNAWKAYIGIVPDGEGGIRVFDGVLRAESEDELRQTFDRLKSTYILERTVLFEKHIRN